MEKKDDFLWGVTNISQQTEDVCRASNWHRWQQCDLVPYHGRGNDYGNRYREDHELVEELGCNAMRVSLDWARIEPEEGKFDEDAIAHYRNILGDIKRRKMTTVVGLWHWSVPLWFEEKYGMHHNDACEKFVQFVQKTCDAFGDQIDQIIILNEPSVYIGTSYLQGTRPPFYKSMFRAVCAVRNLIAMHRKTFVLWKEKYPQTKIGSTHLWNDIGSVSGTLLEKVAVKVSVWLRIGLFVHATKNTSDFIGINYYTSDNIYFQGVRKMHTGILGFHGTNDWHSPDVWRHFAAGLKRVLLQAKKYSMPLIICEHGKPTNPGVDDHDRVELLTDGIDAIHEVMREKNVDVRGYFHYALTDAYEWDSGYDFKFGLVEIDRKNLKRTKRKSFDTYKKLIEQNG